MNDQEHIIGQAAVWHLASAQDDMDWIGFTAWLEADPHHRAAYDEVALSDAVLAEHASQLRAGHVDAVADAPPPSARRWPIWAGLALAASVVAMVAGPMVLHSDTHAYATSDTARTIAMADGSQVELAPRSKLTVDGTGSRLTLQGGAYFTIRHDPSRQMSIKAGALEVNDIGTQFDIQADAAAVRIAVSDGQVQVAAPGLARPVTLPQGKGLTFDPRLGDIVLRNVAAMEVGKWRAGRLTYDEVPLALVAQDLSRYAGVQVAVPDDLGNRRFSGTLVIGNGEAAVTDLAQLMGLHLRRGAGSYRLDH